MSIFVWISPLAAFESFRMGVKNGREFNSEDNRTWYKSFFLCRGIRILKLWIYIIDHGTSFFRRNIIAPMYMASERWYNVKVEPSYNPWSFSPSLTGVADSAALNKYWKHASGFWKTSLSVVAFFYNLKVLLEVVYTNIYRFSSCKECFAVSCIVQI